jgi:hypothetical protein
MTIRYEDILGATEFEPARQAAGRQAGRRRPTTSHISFCKEVETSPYMI